MLNLTGSCDRSNRTGTNYNYITTADLTHDNHGNDTSSDGSIPDDTLIYFSTALGTLNTSSPTRNGKAVAILNSATSGIANVTATLDSQSISIPINVTSINELGIYNTRTNEGFETIQAAINDTDTLNNDTITLKDGTYIENVIVNKKLTIKPVTGENVIVEAADLTNSVFTITSSGSGSTIQGLNINGGLYGIFLNNTSGCNITENSILDNAGGIYLNNATNNTINSNILISNGFGVNLENSNSNTISGNNVKNNFDGIDIYRSNNNTITENNIINNYNGIYLYNSSSNTITDNIITNNGIGIAHIDSNSTTSGNNVTENWIENISQINSTEIIMSTNEYNCGPATLATVLKNMGINVPQEELATLADADETGTTVYGLLRQHKLKV